MRVLFLANIPSPYRVNFFNEWGKHCDLTVLFEQKSYAHRDNTWQQYAFENFKGIFLKEQKFGHKVSCGINVYQYLKKSSYDHVIVTDFTSLTGILAIEYMRIKRIPYILESDGGFAKSGHGFKEAIKKHFIKNAKCYLSTAIEHDQYYTVYGADQDKIIRYPFTSLYHKDILEQAITAAQKSLLKRSLGITEERVILSVGQFIPRKGYDLLLQACKSLDRTIGVYIVGGTPTQEFLEFKKANQLDQVHFVGFKTKDELNKYYQAADVFVLPTREDIWGLVVNEAMAQSLPVVTTDRCIAGLELVQDGITGFIVPIENVERLTASLSEILNDDALRERMSEQCLRTISRYTIEKMVEVHCQVLQEHQEGSK